DTEASARQIAPLLRPGAVAVSLQNGVDNVERMRGAGLDALGAVVYVAAAMAGPGHLRHSGRGDLVIGEYGSRGQEQSESQDSSETPSARALAVAHLFEGAGVP